MFISSKEKLSFTLRITVLEERVDRLSRSLNSVLDQLSTNPDYSASKVLQAKREKRNSYATAYYYKKKAEKLAAQQTQPKE
jgi:hypothetical protein